MTRVVMTLLCALTLNACAADSEQACAFNPDATYLYRLLPDGREQGPDTLRGIVGAPPDAAAVCAGESYTVRFDGAELTFRVTDTDNDALIVSLTGSGAAAFLSMVEQ